MKKADINPPQKKSKIDINKPADFKPSGSFWHKPSAALWLSLLFITVPLWTNDLENKGVKYSMHQSGNWLSNFVFS